MCVCVCVCVCVRGEGGGERACARVCISDSGVFLALAFNLANKEAREDSVQPFKWEPHKIGLAALLVQERSNVDNKYKILKCTDSL